MKHHIGNLFGLTTALEVEFKKDVKPEVCTWLVLVGCKLLLWQKILFPCVLSAFFFMIISYVLAILKFPATTQSKIVLPS